MTGFACLLDSDPLIETDGISGALAISKSLAMLGRQVVLIMDKHSERIMKETVSEYFKATGTGIDMQFYTCGKGMINEEEKGRLAELSSTCDAIISIERPSVNPNGSYMTMRAIDIIANTAEVD